MKTNIMFAIILLIAAKAKVQQNSVQTKTYQLQKMKFSPNIKMPVLKK